MPRTGTEYEKEVTGMKKIIIVMIFLLALPSVFADIYYPPVNELPGWTLGSASTWGSGEWVGMNTTITNQSIGMYNFTNVTKDSLSQATTAAIFEKNSTPSSPRCTATFSGDVAKFTNCYVNLSISRDYVVASKGANGWDSRATGASPFVVTGKQVNWVYGLFESGGAWTENNLARSLTGMWGFGFNVTLGPPPSPANLTITCSDYFDSSSISNCTANIYGQGQNFNQTTGNGTILIVNVTENKNYNITISSNQSGGYITNYYYDINITQQTLATKLWQAVIYVNASELITLNPLLSFGIRVNSSSTINISNSTGFATLRLKKGTFNVTGNITPYFNSTSEAFTLSPFDERYVNLTFFSSMLRIDARSVINGSYIGAFTIQLNSTSYTYFANSSTTNGNATFNLINGTYLFSIYSSSLATQNASISFLQTNSYPNYTFSIATINSINISIYDEFIGKPNKLFVPVTLEVVGDVSGANYTINGSGYIDLLVPSNYRISFSASNYPKRDYYTTIVNGTHQDIELYLLSTGNSTDLTFTIEDENVRPVANATIKLLRYYVNLGQYVIVAMSRTDSDGQAKINHELFNAFYYHVIEQDGETLYVSNPARIIKTTINYPVTLGENILISRQAVQEVFANVSFNNATNFFRFVYNDPTGILSEACLEVFRLTAKSRDSMGSSCSTSSSGTILLFVNTSANGLYQAYGRIETNTRNSPYILDVEEVFSDDARRTASTIGRTAIMFGGYLLLGLALIGAPYIWLSVVFVIVGLILMTLSGLLNISYVALSSIVIIGAYVIYKGGKFQ